MYSENPARLGFGTPSHSSSRSQAKFSCDARNFRGQFVAGPKTGCFFWHTSSWVGSASSNNASERSTSSVSSRSFDDRLRHSQFQTRCRALHMMCSWTKQLGKELQAEMILGPFFNLNDVPFPTVRLLSRFGTREQHGGTQEPTVRLIDDVPEGGQNGATRSQYTIVPPIWTIGPLNVAWCKNASQRHRCRSFQAISRKRTNRHPQNRTWQAWQ